MKVYIYMEETAPSMNANRRNKEVLLSLIVVLKARPPAQVTKDETGRIFFLFDLYNDYDNQY